ncbi:xanthine dehydrogenase family protein subunit M [Rhodopseudomonas sp. HC1]|uniref:FAD binding domain-containing protein n=1 Tax=Rhodopseudomonas infernalis TaxID=2897386 RepID=UPI001EE8AA2B|nr:xanthine dehydrogenase family protein subunit M [Rhodopseudomonas infernalis]MCG6204224.1 xanthine dehydrogenase family protein subunit M [Rhodopseudomonas infernalis]
MKLPAFDYARPTSLSEAISLLQGDDAKVLAGGQSLLPMMAFRLAAPRLLVDIARVPGLDQIVVEDGTIRLGAGVRWCQIAASALLAEVHPLLVEAIGHVAHLQIRSRGTIGGSIAHADPAAELPAVALACDASVVAVGPSGPRLISIAEFLTGPLETSLDAAEIVTEIRIPAMAGRRYGFAEFARRPGDFALAGICLHYAVDAAGVIGDSRVVAFAAVEMPQRLFAVERCLDGRRVDDVDLANMRDVLAGEVDCVDDLNADRVYRTALLGVILEDALAQAHARGGAA